jgi:hypothetical protein
MNAQTMKGSAGIAQRARALIDDPVDFFADSLTASQSLSRQDTAELQLEGLRLRFDSLRDRLGMLKRLSDAQRVSEIRTVDDVVPLLFEHTVYKSYPASLLLENRFDQLTRWLQKLTVTDLSQVDLSHLDGIDAWIERIDTQSDLRITHSSGTSGTLSFLPWSERDFHKFGKFWPLNYFQTFGAPPPAQLIPEVHVISGLYRYGNSMQYRNNEMYLHWLAGCEQRLHCADPGKLSSDMMYLAARMRTAKARGELEKLQIPASLAARLQQFQTAQQSAPQRLEGFLADTLGRLTGERIFMGAVWNIIYNFSMQGLAAGRRQSFAPDSCIATGGGSKGLSVPPDWQERVKEFTGARRLAMGYGMSELSAVFAMCDAGHYHLVPWIIPFVLDPDSSAPLPRRGVVTGRAAFFDLLPAGRWGGFISGDEVTLDWDSACPCGRSTVFFTGAIQRYSEKRGGDDKINCVAAQEAHDEALAYLLKQQVN